MQWGQAWSVGWGDPEDFFQPVFGFDLFTPMPGGVVARFVDPDGFAGYTRIVADGVAQGIKRATPGDLVELTATWERAGLSHVVSLVPQGGWAGPIVDPAGQQNAFMASRADQFGATITAQPTLTMYREGRAANPLSALTLHQLRRFTNVSPVKGRPTWGMLKMDIVTYVEIDATYRYIGLYLEDDTLIAFGRVVLGIGSTATVTLIPYWGFDVWGQVTITYTADINDVVVLVRWPASYQIHYRTGSAFSGGDFPRTPQAAIPDDGAGNLFDFKSPVLAAGTYHIDCLQIDECGNASPGSIDKTLVAILAFAPPTDLIYVSGDYSNTVISFTPSASGVADAFHLYDSAATGELSFLASISPATVLGLGTTTPSGISSTATTLHIAAWQSDWPAAGAFYVVIGTEKMRVLSGHGTTILTVLRGALGTTKAAHSSSASVALYTIVWQLPALGSSTFVGARFVVVRAVKSSVEEGNLNILQIEYGFSMVADGIVIPPRPPAPQASSVISTSGRTLTVRVTIDTRSSAGVADTLQITLLKPGVGGFTPIVATVALTQPEGNAPLIFASISVTGLDDDIFFYSLLTLTADGVPSATIDGPGPVVLTTSGPADPLLDVIGVA